MTTVDSILEHYGKLGMKWGHRKGSSGGSSTGSKDKVPHHEDAVKAALAKDKVKKSSVHSLSNKELQDVIQRMNLEQQYKRLSPKHPAKAFVSGLLVGTGKRAASTVLDKTVAGLLKS